MGNYADCSDAIARVQACIAVLEYLEPDGNWSKSPLYRQWRQFPYALHLDHYEALADELEGQFAAAHRKYLQRRLAGNRKDPTRIQLELPGVRYGSQCSVDNAKMYTDGEH